MTNFQAFIYCLFAFVMWTLVPWRLTLIMFRIWFWWTLARISNATLLYAKRKFNNIKLPNHEEEETVRP